jgi:lysophospholipase L1-like esterase
MFTQWMRGLIGVAGLGALLLAASTPGSGQAAKRTQWVGTWATSPMLAQDGFSVHPFCGDTLREIVHLSNGGQQLRVRFTNEFGLDQLIVGDAHVALSAGGGAIQPGTDHALAFGGAPSVSIPPGAVIYSDPVELKVQPLSDLVVSFYLPAQVMRAETYHSYADQDNYFAGGDQTAANSLAQPTTVTSWYFLDGVDVLAVEEARAIVTLGDSITDGVHSTHNANHRWPDILAARLKQDHSLDQVSVLNEGIGGNHVLIDSGAPSALARLDRDVLAQDGANYLIVLESINDIGRLQHPSAPQDIVTTEQIEQGFKQIADAAHEHGMKVYGATLTPYGGSDYYFDKGEQVREAVNNWIRTSGTFDAVLDFDRITRDPANPNRFNPEYDFGDHIHPNDAGYKAMADSIDLKLFSR